MMPTVRENLIAARALIDTPEKLAEVGSVREACRQASPEDDGSAAFSAFLEQEGRGRFVRKTGNSYTLVAFESFMDRFDRAIAAQGDEVSKPDLADLIERLKMRELALLASAKLTRQRRDDAALFRQAAEALEALRTNGADNDKA